MIKDKVIEWEGFKGEHFIVTERWLWAETLIEQIYCDKCKDGVRITFHNKDIPKLIKVLQKLREQKTK